MEKITVLLIDRYQMISAGIAFLLQSRKRYDVLAVSNNAVEAFDLVMRNRPQVIICDLAIASVNEFELMIRLRKYCPGVCIVWIGDLALTAFIRKMKSFGVRGYLTRNASLNELVNCLEKVTRQERYIGAEVRRIVSRKAIELPADKQGKEILSFRELSVIGYLKRGFSSREIADTIGISIKTVEVHRYNILRKLGLKNVAALITFAHANGI